MRDKLNFIHIISEYLMFIIIKFFSLSLKNIPYYRNMWLISERGNEARDNGYHLYRYIKEHHPTVNTKFIITKNSPDINRIDNKDIVRFKSINHYICFALAEKLVSTHIMGYSPNSFAFTVLDKKDLLNIQGKKVFLQHGIIKDYINGLCYPNIHLDLFVCGAKPEYDFVKSNFGFDNGIVKYLGLSRFDNLHNHTPKRQILLMPTWRMWLNQINEIKKFEETNYYKTYNELINNPKLIQLLIDYDYDLVFYPHYEIQKYIESFKSVNSRIKIAKFENYDVQKLLIDSSILLTDYSSVYFDFAYMEKSLVYFQFDYEEFCKSHYAKGYFNYIEHGFGPVVKDINILIEEVEKLLQNECIGDKIYNDRRREFFPILNVHNSKRNYEAIKNL